MFFFQFPLCRKSFYWFVVLVLTFNVAFTADLPYLNSSDKERLKDVFTTGLAQKDLAGAHFSVLGYKLLGEKIPKLQELCKLLSDSVAKEAADTFYYVSVTWKAAVCPGTLQTALLSKYLTSQLEKDGASASDLYYSILGLKALNQKATSGAKVAQSLQAALKKDDSLASLAYGLHVAAELGATDGGFMFDRIEDAIVQADEIDGKYLQFEGGLSITALMVSGAYKLSSVVNKAPPITADQAIKFSNYFITRKSVQTPKGAWSLLNILKLLTSNKFQKPVVVSLSGIEGGKLIIKVADLLGNAIGTTPAPVSLDSLTRTHDSSTVGSKAKFEPNPTDKTLYSVKLPADISPGLYKASITVASPDPVVIGGANNILQVKITGQLVVTDPLLIAPVDSDHFLQPKYNKVVYPEKLPQPLEVDSLQRLALRFSIREKSSNKPISVHQAFVRLFHTVTGQELIFVTERDSSNGYKLDLDIGAKASDFGQLSGVYSLEIIAGDSVLSNSLQWHAANVKLSFAGEPKAKTSHQALFSLKPEIKHLFREPEKRPPVFVSNLFTGLVFLPLLLLFILWFKLGINISNFNIYPSTLGFHLGLGGIFCLFGLFWLQLNMFETLKYLLALGLVTFISGNKLLASIAAKQKV